MPAGLIGLVGLFLSSAKCPKGLMHFFLARVTYLLFRVLPGYVN